MDIKYITHEGEGGGHTCTPCMHVSPCSHVSLAEGGDGTYDVCMHHRQPEGLARMHASSPARGFSTYACIIASPRV